MNFIVSAVTNQGAENPINQDGFAIRSAKALCGHMCMAVLCDGLGGLSQGEIASSYVVVKLEEWFIREVPHFRSVHMAVEKAKKYLNQMNEELMAYGMQNGMAIGTTATLLFLASGKYAFLHVGDTRIYRITEICRCITKDHSINDGVLTQCVGGTAKLHPQTGEGFALRGNRFLLCTDGFRHKNDHRQFSTYYKKRNNQNALQIDAHSYQLIERCRYLGEKDNVTVIVIRVS